VFRNVGMQNSDAGELPRRKHTTGNMLHKQSRTTDKGRFFNVWDGRDTKTSSQ
jgi:hypothetical protein